ncbi:MAG: 5-formyltetrahydrofolate cyclo-ligase, partial [Pseudomonadota bacterium]
MSADAKTAARKAAFARRKAAFGTGLDPAAQAHLRAALRGHEARPLAGYMPIRTEVDALPVMSDWTAPVGVPVIRGMGQPLDFHLWTAEAVMVDGPFGAALPESAVPMVPEVVIVPLVAFDGDGYRLGYGGGFYDRSLEILRAAGPTLAVGYAFAAQEAEALPREPARSQASDHKRRRHSPTDSRRRRRP